MIETVVFATSRRPGRALDCLSSSKMGGSAMSFYDFLLLAVTAVLIALSASLHSPFSESLVVAGAF